MSIREILLLVSLMLALVAVPLVMGRIGPNRYYGFRTPRTLADSALWYRANAFAGRALLIAACVSAAATGLAPDAWFGQPTAADALLVLPVLAAVVASIVYLRRQ